jgi:CsoR family transcriptional regulator, copper-sensing transcriptional repressor
MVRTEGGASHGYIKASHKEKLQRRLRRIEGQVRGIQRMVDEEAYCVDILTQLSSIVAAEEQVALLLLRDHVEHCVRESIEEGKDADEKIDELTTAVARFLKV